MAGLVSAIEAETGCRVASSVVVGNLLKAVVERAARAGLLVVGARGEHPVRDFAIGTTGERLIRKRRGAMLVARCQPVSSYRRVLAPVDFSKHSAPVVRQAIAIAPTAQIVIGKHGQSIVEDLLLGSVTLHVLGEARCDVLVVSAAQP